MTSVYQRSELLKARWANRWDFNNRENYSRSSIHNWQQQQQQQQQQQ